MTYGRDLKVLDGFVKKLLRIQNQPGRQEMDFLKYKAGARDCAVSTKTVMRWHLPDSTVHTDHMKNKGPDR